jgi:hypothetical protein
MKVSESKKLTCPINSKLCIVNQCPKWKYTKVEDMFKFIPAVGCECGQARVSGIICPQCNHEATEEFKERAIFYALHPLDDEDKEGMCTL